jgi:hypothetical protein
MASPAEKQTDRLDFLRSSLRDSNFVLALILAISGILQAWDRTQRLGPIDYYHFWIVAQTVRQDRARDVYSHAGRTEVALLAKIRATEDAFVYVRELSAYQASLRTGEEDPARSFQTLATPLLFAVIGSLSTGDYERDYLHFARLSLGLYVAGIAIFCRLLGYSARNGLLAIGFFTLACDPMRIDQQFGNVNEIQLGLVALALWALIKGRRAWRLAGAALLGVLVAFKPNLLLVPAGLLLAELFDRRFARLAELVAGLAVGAALGVAGGALYFGGLDIWLSWRNTLPEMLTLSFPVRENNYSLSQVVFEVTGVDLSLPFLLLGLALLAVALWQSRLPATASEEARAFRLFLAAVLPVPIALLSARLAWAHYFLALAPLLLMTLRPRDTALDGQKPPPPALFSLAALSCWLMLAGVRLVYEDTYPRALIFDYAAGLLFLLGIWELENLRDKGQQPAGVTAQKQDPPADFPASAPVSPPQ